MNEDYQAPKSTRDVTRPAPGTVFRSKWVTEIETESGEKKRYVHASIAKRLRPEGTIKGKLARKFAKRQRVKEMKAARERV